MRIEYFYVRGFRRIKEARVLCGDATFLIGENNIGKSSILKAMEIFFSEINNLEEQDFFRIDELDHYENEIVLEAKFTNLPDEAENWRGFKGRIIRENINGERINCVYYRKKYFRDKTKVIREIKSFSKSLKPEFERCKTLNNYIENGIEERDIVEVFGDFDKTKNIAAKDKDKLELISDLWNVNEGDNDWAINPGGIEGNISIKLPKFLLIPAEYSKGDIEDKNGTLQKIMNDLFEDVRESSENYQKAQEYLNLLAQELNPEDEQKEFGKMLLEINRIISGVFADTKIHIDTNLSDPSSSIKPLFDIEMSSNVRTKPGRQGTGSLRSTVFALLRYRETFAERKRAEGVELRPIIIGFEEPEMYLHPNAASLMREKIYELATSTHSRIICTTHSPYMIDLSKKIDEGEYPKQVLNLFKLENDVDLNYLCCKSTPFNTTQAYRNLQDSDKDYIKFILKIDDNVAKVFFCKRVIIVEGDTEEVLLKETVARLDNQKRQKFLADYQILKARGKATIISLVRYLRAMSIMPFVIHDKDLESGATKFNEPILNSLDNNERFRYMVENTIEDILGYAEPSGEKPFKAYKYIQNSWSSDWEGIQENWRDIFSTQIAPELFHT